MTRYRFITACTDSTYEDMRDMLDDHPVEEVSRRAFARAIGLDAWKVLQRQLGYDKYFSIRNDWHVGYYKGEYRGVPCYFLRHSGIEYIFTLDAKQGPSRVMKTNPFLSKARGAHRGRSASLGEREGFHTASDIDLVIPYANLKGSPYASPSHDPAHYDDYPVILHFDMAGLTRVPDIDCERAFEVVLDNLKNMFPKRLSETMLDIEHGDPDEFIAEIEADDEMSQQEFDAGDTVGNALWILSNSPSTVAGAWSRFRNWFSEDGHAESFYVVWRKWRRDQSREDAKPKPTGTGDLYSLELRLHEVFGDDVLCQMFGQQKYLEDIPFDRLVAVQYMRPYAEFVIDDTSTALFPPSNDFGGDDFDSDGYLNALTDFGLVAIANTDPNLNPKLKTVWTRPDDRIPGIPPEPRVEFHGTSYQNLLSALYDSPDMVAALPKPPKPYGITPAELESLHPSQWSTAEAET